MWIKKSCERHMSRSISILFEMAMSWDDSWSSIQQSADGHWSMDWLVARFTVSTYDV